MAKPSGRLRRRQPHKLVVGFAVCSTLDKFGSEESTTFAVILALRGGKDKFVCRANQSAELNVQPTFFSRLSDGGLRGRLAAVLTAAR
jgi:hypothetical protein